MLKAIGLCSLAFSVLASSTVNSCPADVYFRLYEASADIAVLSQHEIEEFQAGDRLTSLAELLISDPDYTVRIPYLGQRDTSICFSGCTRQRLVFRKLPPVCFRERLLQLIDPDRQHGPDELYYWNLWDDKQFGADVFNCARQCCTIWDIEKGLGDLRYRFQNETWLEHENWRYVEDRLGWWNPRRFAKEPIGMFLPIWTTSTHSHLDFKPPKDTLNFTTPRTLTHFKKSLPTLYPAAIAAYGTLLAVSSKSPHYLIELIQIMAFTFFPMLPIVQLISNIATLILSERRWKWRQARIVLAAACGQYTTLDEPISWSHRQRLTGADIDDMDEKLQSWFTVPWLGSMLLALGPGVFSAMAFAKYVQRLSLTWGSATFVAALGLDYRGAWMALGTVVASLMILGVQLANATWKLGDGAVSQP